MTVSKGQIQPDGRYVYTCGYCHGAGMIGRDVCPHCYDLHLPTLYEHFATARGERYYAILKTILSIVGKEIVDAVKDLKTQNPAPLAIDVLKIFVVFIDSGWPQNRFLPWCEWLAENGLLRGTFHSRLTDQFTVKHMVNEARLAMANVTEGVTGEGYTDHNNERTANHD